MLKFIKICDQYPCRLNFGNFFNSMILSFPLSAGEKCIFRKGCLGGVISFFPGGDDKNLWESFAWGHEQKGIDSIFWLTNVFASNLNTINLTLANIECRPKFLEYALVCLFTILLILT